MIWIVGITKTCDVLGVFPSHDDGARFISELPNHLDGIYYLDQSESFITPKGLMILPPGEYRMNYLYGRIS